MVEQAIPPPGARSLVGEWFDVGQTNPSHIGSDCVALTIGFAESQFIYEFRCIDEARRTLAAA